ncbi:hypothetical protein [Streptomyces doebereineriae]|uniref:XRE family transcriptional regulator n=1 Tax=Streptomyces doebereineriae TaxID=3075528 RepID=A0ABU2VG19_9ACTN|nr:hypothetical protein [Streptomyces sp. DSM 41640]MDT0484522.1 hypothetical protein [Streptomyces sp. DSM 41640]
MLFFRLRLEQLGVRTPEGLLALYQKTAKRLGDPNGDPALKTVDGWLYRDRKPQRAFRNVVEEMTGYRIETLWSEVPADAGPDYIPPSGRSLDDSRGVADAGLLEMQRTGAMAVQRAKEFLMGKDRGTVGEDTLGLLDDEVTRLVLAYPREPLSVIWNDLLATQEQVFRLLEGGRLKPSQLRDLNYKGAVLAFMVAKGFNDMQSPFQAMTMTRVAQACARDAEHDGLIALTDGLKSLISYWAHKPDDAYHFARKGAALTSPDRGTVGLWLLGLQARAAAVLGDAETVSELNRRATEQRDHVTPDGLDALGGLFTYSPAKQLYYTVESEALLGRGSAELATQAEAAVAAFSDRTSPDWAFGDLAGAQCDLAIVRLNGGDADGTAEALRPVLDLPHTHRNNGIIVSAMRVREALAQSPAVTGTTARDLCAEIDVFPVDRPALTAG